MLQKVQDGGRFFVLRVRRTKMGEVLRSSGPKIEDGGGVLRSSGPKNEDGEKFFVLRGRRTKMGVVLRSSEPKIEERLGEDTEIPLQSQNSEITALRN